MSILAVSQPVSHSVTVCSISLSLVSLPFIHTLFCPHHSHALFTILSKAVNGISFGGSGAAFTGTRPIPTPSHLCDNFCDLNYYRIFCANSINFHSPPVSPRLLFSRELLNTKTTELRQNTRVNLFQSKRVIGSFCYAFNLSENRIVISHQSDDMRKKFSIFFDWHVDYI